MKDGENIQQGGIYAATKRRLKNLDSPEKLEDEIKIMQRFGDFYARILQPSLEENSELRNCLIRITELQVTTSYPLLLRLFHAQEEGTISDGEFILCLGLIESFVVRRAVCGVPANSLNKLFLQWAKTFPVQDHAKQLLNSMSAGSGGRRFPNDVEFSEAFTNQAQYGRGATRFVLCRLEGAFDHKEPAALGQATIEHILPQTLSNEWRTELGENAERIHAKVADTFGNLTLTAYNAELGNLSFKVKKEKLADTHIELNRWLLKQEHWGEEQINERAKQMLKTAKSLWVSPETIPF